MTDRQSLLQRTVIFNLMLIAVLCVPLAARNIVRDAGTSLLLPVSLFGLGAAWSLTSVKAREILKALVLVLSGPLFLFLYVGQIGGALMSASQASFILLPKLVQGYWQHVDVDITGWVTAQNQLGIQVSVLGGRVFLWVTQFWRGAPAEDPTARALVWSILLWLVAVWAGWQVWGRNRVLAGLLPSTLVLGLIVNSNGQETTPLWIHLSVLLILLGWMQHEIKFGSWERARNDYVEATRLNSIVAIVLLASFLVMLAYLASNISIKHLIDEMREKKATSTTTQNSQTTTSNQTFVPYKADDLKLPHFITGNPKLTDDVVMLISTGDLPPMPSSAHPNPIRYYWRAKTYDTYSWIGWSNQYAPVTAVPAQTTLLSQIPPGYHIVHQQVQFPAGASGQLYWTDNLLSVDVPLQAAWRRKATADDPFLSADLLGASTTATNYTAESLRLDVNEADLRQASTQYPDWIRQRYLTLPDSVPERVLALARNLTSRAATPYDRAVAIEAYLRQFPYTLDVPAPPTGRDAVDYFLFDLKEGYCDYYATAMVVLSRAAGLPARFVTGYSSGAYDSEKGYYVVTAANAHAWAEIYFPAIGWVEFEPTASLPAPAREGQGNLPPAIPQVVEPPSSFGVQLGRFFQALMPKLWLPVVSAFLLALLWMPIDSLLHIRFQTEQAIQYFYRRLRQTAAPLTGPLHPSQTLDEYADALTLKLTSIEERSRFSRWLSPARAELRTLTDLYARSLFTASTPTRAEAVNAARLWSRLYWRLLLSTLLFKLGRRSR